MNVAVVVDGIPNPTTGGGALTAWSVMSALVDGGHGVQMYGIEDLHASPTSIPREAQVRAITEQGVGVTTLQMPHRLPVGDVYGRRLARLVAPTFADYFPSVALAPRLSTLLREARPDAVFVYGFWGLAPVSRLTLPPVVAGVGDPAHLPGYYRWRSLRARPTRAYCVQTIGTAINAVRLPRAMRRMLRTCAVSGAFAAHHAAWFRSIGVDSCQYFRTPVVDEAGKDWSGRRAAFRAKRRPKVLLIGHLAGTATLSGLYLFAREVLPVLEERLGPDGVEVHVVGGYAPSEDLRRLLDRPTVRMRGQIEPAHDEFLSADVLVVPTPIELGIRVRILTGFSFGCCIVAHRANQLGIPELVHGRNALLASNGREMADAILMALDDAALRERLGVEARRAYEEHFAPGVAGARIVAEIERVASA